MIIEGNDGRMSLNLTKAETIAMIEKLAKSLTHANLTGNAWFAEGVVYSAGDKQFSGRFTIRVGD